MDENTRTTKRRIAMCTRKHTKYQPDDEHWRCPKCGEKEDFFIDNYDVYVDDDEACTKFHEDDFCVCEKCNYGSSGKVVSASLMKLDKQVVCPTCKGKGTIDGKTDSA